MVRRLWELHRSLIILGLLGLGFGTWFNQDSESYTAIVLKASDGSITVYIEDGRTLDVEVSKEFKEGLIVRKEPGSRCCMASPPIDDVRQAALEGRFRRFRSAWRGEVVGFVLRAYPDDADTAIVATETGDRIEWKVWEGHLAGLRKGERLCKSAMTWAPERCPSAGIKFELRP